MDELYVFGGYTDKKLNNTIEKYNMKENY